MMPFERVLVDAGAQRMHVALAGPATGVPVLMVHGNPTWSFLWRKVAGALAGVPVRLVMPDLIGLGRSDKPGADFHTLENHAAHIDALLDGLGIDRVIFAGQDWGGPIGLRALAERPPRVAGLVLLNTVASPPRPGFRPTAFHRFARLPVISELAFRGLGFPQRAFAFAQGDRASISGEVARAYRYPLARLRDNAAPLALARMVPDGPGHPSIDALKRCQRLVEGFRGPAAIVWGDRDPILGSVRSWIEKLLPQATVTATTAGHFLQEEVPFEIATAIREVANA
jgi:haloalkane dehalogenase